jgi:UDP-glucose 4-epimerase
MEQPESRVYNLGTGKSVSINHIFLLLKSLTGYNKEPLYVPDTKGEIIKTSLTAAKAKQELGWVPEMDLEKGLKIALNYYKHILKAD